MRAVKQKKKTYVEEKVVMALAMHSHWRTTPTTLSLQTAHGFKSLDYIILQAQIIRWPHLTKVKNVSCYSANALF